VYNGAWNQQDQGYAEVGTWLDEQDAGQAIVMVGNAPGFTWHTGHIALAIPNESLETILDVADRYGARYLVLDDARPRTTDELYRGEVVRDELTLRHRIVGEQGVLQVYEITGLKPASTAVPERDGTWAVSVRRLRLLAAPCWSQ
jgi:hypothetical protein